MPAVIPMPPGVDEVCRRYGVRELSLFGSRARGEESPGSDLDLLYELEAGTRLGFAVVDLADELSALFGLPVDLVPKRGLKPLIRDEVLAESQVLYAA